MTPLYERCRPRSLDHVVGQPKAVDQARRLIDQGIGGKATWISGPSGTGKTSIARILAESIADRFAIEELDAGALTADRLRSIEQAMFSFGWGKGGRVYIVNEAHGLRADSIRRLLVPLESLPGHVAWIFTTTAAGEDKLFDDQIDAGPLMSRCRQIALTNQGTAAPFAALLERVAVDAGLNGCPDAEKVALGIVRRCKGNMRAALLELEDGAMAKG